MRSRTATLAPLLVVALCMGSGPGLGARAQDNASPASIVYALDRDDRYPEIHLMRENGDPFARLTFYRAEDLSPAWSPDGSRIAFVRDSDPKPPEIIGGDIMVDANENYDLYTMDPDGSHVTRITRGPAQEGWPEWSPDGSRIAYVTTAGEGEERGDFDIFIFDVASGESHNVTNDPADDYAPSWSPDGSALAFYSMYRPCTEPCDPSQADVYTMPVTGGEPLLLTGPEFDDIDPTWAPDGERIYFGRAACCQFDIWSMAPDGSDRTRHTRTRDADEGNISFSSDPGRFVFERSPGGRSSIWMMDLASGTEKRLSPRGQYGFTPDWR